MIFVCDISQEEAEAIVVQHAVVALFALVPVRFTTPRIFKFQDELSSKKIRLLVYFFM